ncbi:MAG: hypothetical protein M3Y41_21965 [Pseudomonadota bacterium]|nr:hypothetical protein [Pseudomonadota bacterium]
MNAYVGWNVGTDGGARLSVEQVERVDALFDENERLKREADLLRTEVTRLRHGTSQLNWARAVTPSTRASA